MQLATQKRRRSVRGAAAGQVPWCLFLDVDGTLLETGAEHPQAVVVDDAPDAAAGAACAARPAARWRSSAAARSPISTACSARCRSAGRRACMAAKRRDARGVLHVAPVALEQLAEYAPGLQRAGRAAIPASCSRTRGAGLALHFLKAPATRDAGARRSRDAGSAAGAEFHGARRSRGDRGETRRAHQGQRRDCLHATKSRSAGALPIFIGDDQTDYGGFAAVRRCERHLRSRSGPREIRVVVAGPQAAVHRWLEQLAGRP